MKLDRKHITVESLHNSSDDVAYWRSRPPQERFEAMQQLRENAYGKDAVNARLQRVLEIVERKKG